MDYRETIPIVLVHGLWDTPLVFRRLIRTLKLYDIPVVLPYLSHQLGRISLRALSKELDSQICNKCGLYKKINLLGFSMGGIVSRIWLQELGGAYRTESFLSVGSPHFGTFTAQLIPSWLLLGLSEMKVGSHLLEDLNRDFGLLELVDCSSFFCKWDLMVVPGAKAALPIGAKYQLPTLTHKGMIYNRKSVDILIKMILSVSGQYAL